LPPSLLWSPPLVALTSVVAASRRPHLCGRRLSSPSPLWSPPPPRRHHTVFCSPSLLVVDTLAFCLVAAATSCHHLDKYCRVDRLCIIHE
jgi:hypothetical protein